MLQVLYEAGLNLHLIDEDCRKDFIASAKKSHDLSSFEDFYLKVTGNLLRAKDTEYFWNEGRFTWWVREFDENGHPVHDKEFCVFLTNNGICCYEDVDAGKLYRVEF